MTKKDYIDRFLFACEEFAKCFGDNPDRIEVSRARLGDIFVLFSKRQLSPMQRLDILPVKFQARHGSVRIVANASITSDKFVIVGKRGGFLAKVCAYRFEKPYCLVPYQRSKTKRKPSKKTEKVEEKRSNNLTRKGSW